MRLVSKCKYRGLPLATNRDDQAVQEALYELGKQGWELVAVYETPKFARLHFQARRRMIFVRFACAQYPGAVCDLPS
jgi:hypothetical protein